MYVFVCVFGVSEYATICMYVIECVECAGVCVHVYVRE